MKDKSKIVLIVVILAVVAVIAYICYGITKGKKNPIVSMEVSYIDADGNEKNGIVKIELYPDVAPQSVANFIALSNNGYYDGLTFHRIEDFVIQGGDKEGTGSGSGMYSDLIETYTITNIENKNVKCKNTTTGEEKEFKKSELPKDIEVGKMIWNIDGKFQTNVNDYRYGIKGEFSANGVNNSLKFEKGVIGMARSDYSSYGMTEEGYNSASTQFFIVNTDDKSASNSLNQNYAPFGKVIEGYEYIEEITKLYVDKSKENTDNTDQVNSENNTEKTDDKNNAEQTENSESAENTEEKNVPKMKSIRVETFGADYEVPEIINVESTISTINQYQATYQQLLQQQSQNSSNATTGSEETAE
ncbi:MAG: peptidylprolyl isomerase [Clostridia bacterium]|nr:peptidylprolyl isomerase [Clostridia bacterium]